MMTTNKPDERVKVSILVPHYRTLDLAKLCLRSIRKFTDLNKVNVIVIDNDSNDDSIEYLRSLNWITLIERKVVPGETPSQSHARALDLGIASSTAEYLLSIHTDTIVCKHGWLDYLINAIEKNEAIAGVGTWKLEQKPALKRFAKKIERFWQLNIWYPLLGKGYGEIQGLGENHYYLRSHCAMYKRQYLNQCRCKFNDGTTAGKGIHKTLTDNGYAMVFLPVHKLISYVKHLNHATMILNPEIAGKKTGSPKEFRRILKQLEKLEYKGIINNTELDRD